MADPPIPVTGDPDANQLLAENPLALLIGMLLDQQVPMEWAFMGPKTLRDRLGALDAQTIADLGPDRLDEVFRAKPALHRYPGSMAKRAHALAQVIVDDYGGDAAAIWRDATDGADLFARVRALPGFGDEKAKIFVALLAKRLGVRPDGWEAATVPFSDANPRSVADIDSADTLARVRDWKRTQKARGKGKAD